MRRDLFVATMGAMLFDSALGLARPHLRASGHSGHAHGRPERRFGPVPKVVSHYIEAWRRGDGAGVVALFGEGGTYADDSGVALTGQTLSDYVNQFRGTHFHVVDVDVAANGVTIHWQIGHGRCGERIHVRDELQLSENGSRITSVRSLGYPPSAEVAALLAEYAAGWATYDGERSLATFAEGGVYYDFSNPDGIGGQALVAYIEGLTWAIIDGLYDLAVLKDGRVFARWDLYLAETGQLLVQGYDFITLRGNAILIVEGH